MQVLVLLRSALSNRALVRVLVAAAAASLSVWAFTILFALAAYDAGGTAALGVAVLVRTLPAAFASPYGSLLADRHARRTVLLVGVGVRAVLLGLLGLAIMGGASLAVVCALGALFTIAGVAHAPALSALFTTLARTPAELAAANVVANGVDYAGFLAGSLLVGTLAGLLGVDVAVLATVVPLVAAGLLLAAVPRDRRPEQLADEPAESVVRELLGGLRAVADDRGLRILTGLFGANMFVQGLMDVLIVLVAIDALGLGEEGVGWLNAAWGVGGLVGGFAALTLLGRGQLARGLLVGSIVAGLGFVPLGVVSGAPAALVALGVLGVGFAITEIAFDTFTQRLTPGDVIARVFGLYETLFVGATALGSIAAAASVALVGLETTVVATGLILPVLALATRRLVLGLEQAAAVPERAFTLLRAVPLFAPLPLASVETLAVRSTTVAYDEGELIIVEGEPGSTFYVIDSGTVEVAVGGEVVRQEGPGEFFGEIALLHPVNRTATVRATSRVELVAVDGPDFHESIGAHPRSSREAMAVADARLATAAAG